MSSCRTSKPMKAFVGSSDKGEIVRKQNNEVLSCKNPKFNEYFCMHKDDFEALLEKCGE